MTSDMPGMHEFEYDWLEPSTHETILMAQRVAAHMQAEQVYPEHYLLGVSLHGDNRAAKILDILGITREKLLALAIDASRLGNTPSIGLDLSGNVLPVSADLQKCIYQAIAVAVHAMHARSVSPEHLVLSVLSHRRVRSFLSPLSLSSEMLLEKLSTTEELKDRGLILAEFFKQIMLASVHGRLKIPGERNYSLLHVLSSFEHPTTRLSDITDLGGAKLVLRAVAEFLKRLQVSQHSESKMLQTVLLIGPPGRERKQLVEAVAGEAGVPLISLAFSGLVAAFAAHDDYIEHIRGFGPSISISVQGVPSNRGLDLTQGLLRDFFLQAKYKSPRLFLIDDLDAVVRLSTTSGREQLLDQLMAEIDFLGEGERAVVIATAERLQNLRPRYIGFFGHHVLMQLPLPNQTKLCPSCKRTVPTHWKRCAYCGASLARVCPQCGAPLPEVEDARFCFECGSFLE
jgi:ATPase family associated with various cellular activities (AAA)/Double zinc ribbon/Clp amino terminal domain, pathogenicity island component